MNVQLEDIANITLEGDSRSTRWKKLKSHLRGLAQAQDAIGDKLASLKEETERVRDESLKLADALQTLSDLASEEVQREVSLTLNDDDYEIVADAPSQVSLSDARETEKTSDRSYDLIAELQKLPSIGSATARKIADHIHNSGEDRAQQLAWLLAEINQDRTSQRSLFDKEGE